MSTRCCGLVLALDGASNIVTTEASDAAVTVTTETSEGGPLGMDVPKFSAAILSTCLSNSLVVDGAL